MKNRISNSAFFSIVTLMFLFFVTTALVQDTEEWIVPERFKQMQNPVEVNNQSIRIGSSLYRRNCRDCHGSSGKGDGSEARDLDTEMRDFGSEEVQNQSDGELFYKTREGRDEMPGFAADIYDEDIWNVVNYLRTFKED